MTPIVVIPARMTSTRLPDKPLADIHGEPMIVHVWRRAQAAAIGPVIVACAEPVIANVVQAVGGRAVLTRPDHPSGSDRVFEAVQVVDPMANYDIVVNLQGDLPTLDSRVLHVVLAALVAPAVDIATLAAPLANPHEATDHNVVKTVAGFTTVTPGASARALYFSRAAVPDGPGPLFHHIGLYAYRRAALARFVTLPPGVLEIREQLEQLRALENGLHIEVVLVGTAPLGVNTPDDLIRARSNLKLNRIRRGEKPSSMESPEIETSKEEE